MIRAGIIGVTGYAGSELLRLLDGHPDVCVTKLGSHSYAGKPYGDVYENYRHREGMVCEEDNLEEMADKCDVLFLALPHGIAGKKISKSLLEKTKIIDLGADFRLKDVATYRQWYGETLSDESLLEQAVYGLCELNRQAVKDTRLVANPGCYTTCSILTLYPLIVYGCIDITSIIIDAKSGVTGAGRGVGLGTHFCEVDESIKAYKIASHRHTPEIEQQLSVGAGENVTVTFTPHLVPMNRGILATCYGKLTGKYSEADIRGLYQEFYQNEKFVRITKPGIFPETKWAKGSNYIDIGLTVDERCGRVIAIGALDNLVKGAAGQAVQNMNILFGLEEAKGLEAIPVFPC